MPSLNEIFVAVFLVSTNLAGCAPEEKKSQRKVAARTSETGSEAQGVHDEKKETKEPLERSSQLTANVPELALSNEVIPISWNPVTDATGYAVKLSQDSKCSTAV